MQLKNVTVKQAIETIQKQNGYSFTFAASDLNTQKIITVTARNLPIEKVVEQILIGQNVSYTVQGKDIIIKKKSNQATQQKKKSTISGIITDKATLPTPHKSLTSKISFSILFPSLVFFLFYPILESAWGQFIFCDQRQL